MHLFLTRFRRKKRERKRVKRYKQNDKIKKLLMVKGSEITSVHSHAITSF